MNKRKFLQIDAGLCIGCGECVKNCPSHTIEMVDGKARVKNDNKCEGVGGCVTTCPTGALSFVDVDPSSYDENDFLKRLSKLPENPNTKDYQCCPSTRIILGMHDFDYLATQKGQENKTILNWPVKLNDVTHVMSFLKGANLLIAADCSAFVAPNFHNDYRKDHAVLIGCPKITDKKEYVDKLSLIFSTSSIKSCTVIYLDVPCCKDLFDAVKEAQAKSAPNLALNEIVLRTDGSELKNV